MCLWSLRYCIEVRSQEAMVAVTGLVGRSICMGPAGSTISRGEGEKPEQVVKEVGDTKDKVVGVAREWGEKARNKKMGKAGEKRKEGSLEKLLPSETLPYSCNAWWGCLEKGHFWTG